MGAVDHGVPRRAERPRSRPRGAFAALVALLAALSAPAALAAVVGERVALVIGNGGYRHVPSLENPRRDADAIAAKLRDIGFEHVERYHDLDRRGLTATLQAFKRRSDAAALAVVYFAGHGIELGGENYLIPIDARLAADTDIEFEAVRLELVLRSVERADKLRLVILDACRNNPFSARMARADATRSVGRGLAEVEPRGDTLIAYAARHGELAMDGRGRNSPFTRALLEHLDTPGLEVQFLFRKVRDSVLRLTDHRQDPHVYGSLGGEAYYLVPPREAEAPVPAARLRVDREAMFWNSIADSESPDDFVEYFLHFPDGLFAGLALNRLKRLQAQGRGSSANGGLPSATDGGLPSATDGNVVLDPGVRPTAPAPDTTGTGIRPARPGEPSAVAPSPLAAPSSARREPGGGGRTVPTAPARDLDDRDPRCYAILRHVQAGGQMSAADRDLITTRCR